MVNIVLAATWAKNAIMRILLEGVMAADIDSVIVQDPEIHSGDQVFRGTRVPFQTLLDYLEGGETLDEFLEQYPGVNRETAIAALEEAKSALFTRLAR
jgi:uncharacterized protein (DUF433 family)